MQKPILITPPSFFSPTKDWQEFLATLNPPRPNEHRQITDARKEAEAELAKRKKLTPEQRQIACSIGQCVCATRRRTAVELVPSKAVEALLMKLRIGNRAAFLAHTGLAECRVSL